jgi:Tfp pilus assembly ATPase PilU
MTKLNEEQIANLADFVSSHETALDCITETLLEQEEIIATQEIREYDNVEYWIEWVLQETLYGQVLAVAYDNADQIIEYLVGVWDNEKKEEVISLNPIIQECFQS